jgi:alpha-beta hydrolase superfamily lysophospholipase/SAM-dependent methyltransferase
MSTARPLTHGLSTGPLRGWCRLSDGARLFYRAWAPPRPSPRAVVLFHRGHEHSDRLSELVSMLGLEDAWVFAWDARGHGHSPGPRGDAETFHRLVRDAGEFVEHLVAEHGIALDETAVVGHSVGAVIAAAWAHDTAPPLRALVLATPAFRVRLWVPFARTALRVMRWLDPRATIRSLVRPALLTRDAAQQRAFAEDPLVSSEISVRLLLELDEASTLLLRRAHVIETPTLVLTAGTDLVVKAGAQRRFASSLPSPLSRQVTLQGFRHAIFHERGREEAVAAVREFLDAAFARPKPAARVRATLAEARSRRESREALRPLHALHPRRLAYGLVTLVGRTLGRLSEGIRLGWREGFSSGATLDHVYENTARGVGPLGRRLDRAYLDAPGWRGIRERRGHVVSMVRRAAARLEAEGRPVRILDVACGGGRYVLEALRDLPHATAILRDRDPGNLEAARRLATALGVVERVTFAHGDAFDVASLAAVTPRPTIAVVSGLWELFSENDLPRRTLEGLVACLEPGSFLVYTNQPWHPQLELIGRVLVDWNGLPWRMRCRRQVEIDQLVAEAGFAKASMAATERGIFTVSLARV